MNLRSTSVLIASLAWACVGVVTLHSVPEGAGSANEDPLLQPTTVVDRAGSEGETVDGSVGVAESVEAGEGGEVPFDLSAVIGQVHFAFRPSPDANDSYQGGHETYAVNVEGDAFTVTAFHHDDTRLDALEAEPPSQATPTFEAGTLHRAEPVRFRTVTLARDDDKGLEASEVAVEVDGHLTLARVDHVEHLRNQGEGVSQSWTFEQRPTGTGDLRVRVAVEGLPMVGSTDQGLHFADASGLGVRYGHATWIDGDGARVHVPARWVGGAIELRVSGEILDEAVYPAVLDPVVGPEFGMDAPVLTQGQFSESPPAIASNGDSYFVVWDDVRSGTSQVYGTRVDANGVVLDPTGIVFGEGEAGSKPTVSSDGTDYMVVWRAPLASLDGARVASDGTLLASPASDFSTLSSGNKDNPAIASDGTGYLLAWMQYDAGTWNVRASRLGSGGEILDAPGLDFTSSADGQGGPSVAFNGLDYLVVWEAFIDGGADSDVRGVRVSTAGDILSPGIFDIGATPDNQRYPSVASDGSDFLVVWADWRDPESYSPDIYGARVDSGGNVLEPLGIPISVDAGYETEPTIASDGSDYMVAWYGIRSEGTGIFGARVKADGTVLDPGGTYFTDGVARALERNAAIASNGASFLLTFLAERNSLISDIDDAYAMRLDLDGTLLDPAGFQLSVLPATNGQEDPAVASNGTDFLVAWLDDRDPTGDPRVYGMRVDSAGNVLDPSGFLIGSSSRNRRESGVLVTSNGSDYFVAWKVVQLANPLSAIYGTRVDSDGSLLDPDDILLGPCNDSCRTADLTSSGEDYFAIWTDRFDRNFGARVGSDGTLLDSVPITLPTGSVPRIASSGPEYFMTWQTDVDPGSPAGSLLVGFGTLYGTPIALDGVVQNAGGIELGLGSVSYASEIASAGDGYLVVWDGIEQADCEQIGPLPYCWSLSGTYGTRITGDGTILDPSGIGLPGDEPLFSGPQPPYLNRVADAGGAMVRLAANGGEYLAIVNDGEAKRITGDGLVHPNETVGTQVECSGIALNASGTGLSVYSRVAEGTKRVFARLLDKRSNGDACSGDILCRSDHCVDAVCCDEICGGGDAADCVACVAALTGATDGTCAPALTGVACGDPAADLCSAPDSCDGTGACLPNHHAAGVSCGVQGTDCIVGDLCDGSGVCVLGQYRPSGTPCGDPSARECDDPDTCNASGFCAANHFTPGTPCGDQGVDCRIDDACDTQGSCADNGLLPAGSACGDASDDQCDAADSCDDGGACLANVVTDGTSCDDGLFCSAGDACAAGECIGGALPSCALDEKCSEVGDACYPACGDGVVDAGESCDTGPSNSDVVADACRTSCTLPRCGDGVLDRGESCDEGAANSDAPDAICRIGCVLASCGDGVIDVGEECDEGELNSDLQPDVCRADCFLASCGDGVVDTAESCDEGDANAATPEADCLTTCALPTCGDGVLDPGEQCDEGDDNADTEEAACRATCTLPACGDGVLTAPEVCDDGAANSDVTPDACRVDCIPATCGDGVVDSDEDCDPDGLLSLLGCTPDCRRPHGADGGPFAGDAGVPSSGESGSGCSLTSAPATGSGLPLSFLLLGLVAFVSRRPLRRRSRRGGRHAGRRSRIASRRAPRRTH